MKMGKLLLWATLLALALLPATGSADVNFGGNVVVEAGKTMDSAVSFGGTVIVRGTVADAVAFGGSVIVENGGRVGGDAVAFGGGVTVRDGGSVGGDAVTLGGTLQVAPGGSVGGERVHIGRFGGEGCANFGNAISRLIFLGPFSGVFGAMGAFFLLLFFLVRVLVWLAVAELFYYLFPERTGVMADSMRHGFWIALLWGFLVLILIPFGFLLLLVSLIGIPLIPLTALTLFLLYLFGSTGVALWVGRLLPNPDARTGMTNVALGILVVSLLRLIPGVGFLMWFLLTTLSLGVVLTTRLGGRPAGSATP